MTTDSLRARAEAYARDYQQKFAARLETAFGNASTPEEQLNVVQEAEKRWCRSYHQQLPLMCPVSKLAAGKALTFTEISDVIRSLSTYPWTSEEINQMIPNAPGIQAALTAASDRYAVGSIPSESGPALFPGLGVQDPVTPVPLIWHSCADCSKRRVVHRRTANFRCGDQVMDYRFMKNYRHIVNLLKAFGSLGELDFLAAHSDLLESDRQNLIEMIHRAPEEDTGEAIAVRSRFIAHDAQSRDALTNLSDALRFYSPPPSPSLVGVSSSRAALYTVMNDFPDGAHYDRELRGLLEGAGHEMTLPALHRLINPNYKEVFGISAPWASYVVPLGKGRYVLRKFVTHENIDALANKDVPLADNLFSTLFDNRMYRLWNSDAGRSLKRQMSDGMIIRGIEESLHDDYPDLDMVAVQGIWQRLKNAPKIQIGQMVAESVKTAKALGLAIGNNKSDMRCLVKKFRERNLTVDNFLSELAVRKSALETVLGQEEGTWNPLTMECTLIANGLNIEKTVKMLHKQEAAADLAMPI